MCISTNGLPFRSISINILPIRASTASKPVASSAVSLAQLSTMSYRNFVAVLAAVSVTSASPIPQDDDTNSISIVGGVPAQAGDFPFIVSLQKSNAHDCGGSLLDSTTVLTAAHCVVSGNADNLSIRAGSLVSRIPLYICDHL